MSFRPGPTDAQIADNLREQIEAAHREIDRYWPTIPQRPLAMRIERIHADTVALIEQCVEDVVRDAEVKERE